MTATWIDLPAGAMNVAAGFRLALDLPAGGATLRLAAADACRVWLDGRLVAHGPARTAHGFARVEEIRLTPRSGDLSGAAALPAAEGGDFKAEGRRNENDALVVFVEVHSSHVPCFDGIEQDAFFAAEVVAADGRVLAGTDDFEAWRDGTLVRRVRRFSYQRGFVESRRVAADPGAFRRGGSAPEGWTRAATVARPLPSLLPRRAPRPLLVFRDAGAPVARGAFAVDSAVEPPMGREVTLVGTQGFKGYLPAEWEDDPAADAARLDSHAESAEFAEYSLYDLERTRTGFFSLRVRAEAPEGATVLLLFDELRAPDEARFPVDPFRNGCSNVVKWRLGAGVHDLLSFHPNSARFVAVAIAAGRAAVERFGVVPYENPDASRVALPPTGDAALDAIVDAARATFAQNAVDLLTDCPSRERAGWLCDAFFTGRAEALFTGGNDAERAFLENFALAPALSSLPDGMVPMCYPAEHVHGTFIPNWALWWLLELDAYRARTGDEETVAASRPKIGSLLAWFDRYAGPEGLLEDLPGWVFVEWSACNDRDHVSGVNFPTNFLWAAALEAAARLLGRPDLAARGASVRAAAARLAWDGEWFDDNALRGEDGALRRAGHPTETGQYYAFYFGAADPATRPALWERLCTEFGPSRDAVRTWPDVPPSNAIVGAYLRLELLLRDGRAEQCLRECRGFFLPMVRLTGTLWENLSPQASLNHGFASSAAWLIHRALAASPRPDRRKGG